MPLFPRLISLWRNLLHRGRVERDLDDELRAYVELSIDVKRDAGLAEREARRAALIELGGLDQVKERVRDVRAGALVAELRRDLEYAARVLRRNPGFTTIAIVTIALGIGSSTAVFSLADTVVFRSLPYTEPDRLVKICGTAAGDRACDDDFSVPELDALRSQPDVFEQIAADDGTIVNLVHPDGSRESLGVGLVSDNWLSTLGVRPRLGRDFAPEDAQAGRDNVVILTHDYWRRHFRPATEVLGTTLSLDGVAHTVIGVLPPNVVRNYADVLKPLVLSRYSDKSLDVFGRLEAGVMPSQANVAVSLLGQRVELELPGVDRGRRLSVEPLGRYYAPVSGRARQGLVLMLGAVGLVLLIACANVANLLLARAAVRRKESVIRSALGASRARLVRQFLIESLLLSVLGGVLGILVASISIDSLTALAASGGYIPEHMTVAIDLRVFSIALLLSLVAGVVFGLFPALQASKVDLNGGLRQSARSLTGDGRPRRAGRLLIVSELSLSLVLLTGFGLLIRSFERIYTSSGGFDAENVLVTESDGGRSFPEALIFWRAALERARAVPGTAFAALTSRPPVHGARRKHFVVDGWSAVSADEAPQAGDILVSSDYFRTLGIPVLEGRAFTEADDERSRPVVIISQSVARRYFQSSHPLGRRVRLLEHSPMTCCSAPGAVENVWREVVGVVGDVRQANLDEEPALTVYRPYSQIVEHDMYLLLRAGSASAASRVAAGLRSQLIALDPKREWADVRAMRQVIHDSESIRLRRFVLILLGSFAAMALTLAAIGVYGIASSAVAERTTEIGVRVALGATRPMVFRQLLREVMVLAAGGVIVGSAGALALTRLIATMLFGVSATDGTTYLGVALLLGSVVVLATYVPARRAMQVDPVVALRHE